MITLPLFSNSKFSIMNKVFFLAISSCVFSICIHAQQFSYTWGPTGLKVDVSISYTSDSSYTLISRKATNSHSFPLLDSENEIVFIGDNIIVDSNSVTLPFNLRKYVFFPFDPAAFGISRLNIIFDSLDYLTFMLGESDTLGLLANNPDTGIFFWCSCGMSEESPGGCLANLTTTPSGIKRSVCIEDSGCSSQCVGWFGPLSPIWVEGGGAIIEIKGNFAHDTYIEID